MWIECVWGDMKLWKYEKKKKTKRRSQIHTYWLKKVMIIISTRMSYVTVTRSTTYNTKSNNKIQRERKKKKPELFRQSKKRDLTRWRWNIYTVLVFLIKSLASERWKRTEWTQKKSINSSDIWLLCWAHNNLMNEFLSSFACTLTGARERSKEKRALSEVEC